MSIIKFIKNYVLQISYAYQRGGILGPYIGQLGKRIVGYVANGRELVRTYGKPTKPPTPAQIDQQRKFLLCEKFAAKELINLIQPYWNHIKSNISGFNSFMSTNLKRVEDWNAFDFILTTVGSYPTIEAQNPTYNNATGDVVVTWVEDVLINTSADDKAIITIIVVDEWDPINGKAILKSYFDDTKKRSEGVVGITIPVEDGLDLSSIFVYLGTSNPATASKILTGDSEVKTPIAAV